MAGIKARLWVRAVVESGSGQQQERTSMSFADTAAELENDRAIPAVEENKCDVYIWLNEAADAPGWAADLIIEIAYILIPQVVCSPSYRGGVLWHASVAPQLPSHNHTSSLPFWTMRSKSTAGLTKSSSTACG